MWRVRRVFGKRVLALWRQQPRADTGWALLVRDDCRWSWHLHLDMTTLHGGTEL